MQHVVFGLDIQVHTKLNITLDHHIRHDLYKALSYMHITIETAIVGTTISGHLSSTFVTISQNENRRRHLFITKLAIHMDVL